MLNQPCLGSLCAVPLALGRSAFRGRRFGCLASLGVFLFWTPESWRIFQNIMRRIAGGYEQILSTAWCWLEHQFYDFPFHIWDVILPNWRFLHHFFFRGVGFFTPPTNQTSRNFWMNMDEDQSHRIGLWEKLQESPIFDGKNHVFQWQSQLWNAVKTQGICPGFLLTP